MDTQYAPPPLIGEAPAFLDMLDRVSSAAPLDRPLLVVGERGSGKELIAARLHFLSKRWDQQFVKINCAALSDDLLESELFGHEAGAFTGASKQTIGRFERADMGSLFLDEIASASMRVQEKILRVLEYGEFERLGGGKTLRCDVRVIAATNVDLPTLSLNGQFRADLLDRLAFDVITLPPLRARHHDIPLLAMHFGQNIARELGANFSGFSEAASHTLNEHSWPGNIRELKNTVERSVYRHFAANTLGGQVETITLDPFASPYRPKGSVSAQTLTENSAAVTNGIPTAAKHADANQQYNFMAHIAAIEKRLLESGLRDNAGNQRRTAQQLELSYDQLRGLLRKHQLAGKKKTGVN